MQLYECFFHRAKDNPQSDTYWVVTGDTSAHHKTTVTFSDTIFGDMKIGKYPVIVGESSMVFEFTSEGIRGRIRKLVIYSETHLHDFYNLGFGDKNDLTEQIDDEVITNNGDSEKVLATVASTLYTFTDKFPEAMVFATGSTKARTRLYRMGISNNLEEIQDDFEIFGLVGENDWQPFQKEIQFQAFLVKRKKK